MKLKETNGHFCVNNTVEMKPRKALSLAVVTQSILFYFGDWADDAAQQNHDAPSTTKEARISARTCPLVRMRRLTFASLTYQRTHQTAISLFYNAHGRRRHPTRFELRLLVLLHCTRRCRTGLEQSVDSSIEFFFFTLNAKLAFPELTTIIKGSDLQLWRSLYLQYIAVSKKPERNWDFHEWVRFTTIFALYQDNSNVKTFTLERMLRIIDDANTAVTDDRFAVYRIANFEGQLVAREFGLVNAAWKVQRR